MRERSLLVYVMALAAAMTLPPLGLALVTASRWVVAERAGLESNTHEIAQRAMGQVDRFLVGKMAMLQALATSPAIDLGDFQRLDRQARELVDLQGLNIVMRDPSGQQLINTRVPWGSPLPRVPLYDVDRAIATSHRPAVSDLYMGTMARGPLMRVMVPVIRNGDLWYTLTASLSPQLLSRILEEAGVATPHSGSIVDRNGAMVARSPYDATLIGKPLPGFSAITSDVGTWSGTNPQGVEVYAAYQRSVLSGWAFTIGINRRVLDGPLYSSIAWFAAFALGLGALAFAASAFIARRIIGAHRQVEAAALALGTGAIVASPATRLREANLIGAALAEASVRIRQQAEDLVAANRTLEHRVEARTREVSDQANLIKATLDNMDQGLMMVAPDGVVAVCNERAIELLDLPAELMRSRPHFLDVLRYQLEMKEFIPNDDPATQSLISQDGLEQFYLDAQNLRLTKAEPVDRLSVVSESVVNRRGTDEVLHTYERERPNGTVLEIRTVPLASGGAVRTFTDITARKSAELLSHHMARHDGLTGLPNRTLFRERLTGALTALGERGGAVAVLCLDLDRFKLVNDTMGHPAGDALLRIVADRIRAAVDERDVVARLGGDEFSVIQAGGTQPHAATALAQRIIEEIRHPVELGGQMIHVGTSVGIVIAPPDGADADVVFKCADLALYRAKSEGRGTFRFYETAMDEAVQERRALERQLRVALAQREFTLNYQPVVNLASGEVTGFEALLRWTHPERGPVGPSEFIPITEESRLIIPIGSWVLREACREATGWPASVRLLVNISAVQIEDPGLTATVLAALAASGLPPSRLQLEITETVLMNESAVVRDTLVALRDFGIHLALDDFGTGHASLSHLHRLPLDALKIDRSFVQGYEDPKTGAIFDAIAGLGTALGIVVTAEGVETAAQLEHARGLGCTEVQGFLFSPPVSAAEARALIDRRHDAAAA